MFPRVPLPRRLPAILENMGGQLVHHLIVTFQVRGASLPCSTSAEDCAMMMFTT